MIKERELKYGVHIVNEINTNKNINNSEAYNDIYKNWVDFVNNNMNDKNNNNKVTEEDERKMKKICETHIEKKF